MLGVSIIGWGHTLFGKLEGETIESLIKQAALAAINHAHIEASEIDEIYLGFYNSGMSEQDFASSLVFEAVPELRFKPSTRVENACATGSAAVQQAIKTILAGHAKTCLVIGVEKMTNVTSEMIGKILLQACYRPQESHITGGFAGIFAEIAKNYFSAFGDASEAMAKIAAKNHANACLNPYAHIKKDLGFAFCNTLSDKNPYAAEPLRRTDCSLISDGAAALIIRKTDLAKQALQQVHFKGIAHVNDYMPMAKRDMRFLEGPAKAWEKVLQATKLNIDDLDLVETHDCFTIAELMQYEAMGLCEKGQGKRAIDEGWVLRDGKLPVNVSGGLKAKGHPIGATGVSMHAMCAMQLSGQAGEMQLKNPKRAGIFNMGGAAVANYVSILEV